MAKNLPALPVALKSESIKARFNDILGKNATGFISALLSLYNNSAALQECDSRSILSAAGLAAILNLSITPSLGQAYVVPFKGKATFQIGVKGLIQLAHRTGKYVALNAGAIRDGEFRGFNPITGQPVIGEKISDKVIGYAAYMRLVNGFEKTLYMSTAEINRHALKYSQSFAYDKKNGKQTSPWSTNFDAMASKTVLKKLLNSWGVLSSDMVDAIQADQSVVDKNSFEYVDNGGNLQNRDNICVPDNDDETFDAETGEPIEGDNHENY